MYAIIIICVLILLYIAFKPNLATLVLMGLSTIVILAILRSPGYVRDASGYAQLPPPELSENLPPVDPTTGSGETVNTGSFVRNAQEYENRFKNAMDHYIYYKGIVFSDDVLIKDAIKSKTEASWFTRWWYEWEESSLKEIRELHYAQQKQAASDAYEHFNSMYGELYKAKNSNENTAFELTEFVPESIKTALNTQQLASVSDAVRTLAYTNGEINADNFIIAYQKSQFEIK